MAEDGDTTEPLMCLVSVLAGKSGPMRLLNLMPVSSSAETTWDCSVTIHDLEDDVSPDDDEPASRAVEIYEVEATTPQGAVARCIEILFTNSDEYRLFTNLVGGEINGSDI